MSDPATKRRRLVRVFIVLAILMVLVGGIYAAYRLNSGSNNKGITDEQALAEARQAFEAEDYEKVAQLLENPSNNGTTRDSVQSDPELLQMYVTARRSVPLFNQRHLSRTIMPLTLLIKLETDNTEHAHMLMQTLLTLNRNEDAITEGKRLSELYPNDTVILRSLAQAQRNKSLPDASIETLGRAIQIDALDVQAYAQMLDVIQSNELQTETFIAQAKQAYTVHAEDMRGMMIGALANFAEGNTNQSSKLLKQASALPPANQEMVPLLTHWLERLGLFAEATRYLMQYAEQSTESAAGRMAIYRAFESDDPATVLARLEGSKLSDLNSDLLGMWAYAHLQSGSIDKATELLDELKTRENAIAINWLLLIKLDQQEQTRPAQVIDPFVDLLQTPDNPALGEAFSRHPYFMYRLGQAYLQAQEPEAAINAFTNAARASNSWVRPQLLMTETLINLGQHKAALLRARDAILRDDSPETQQWLVLAMASAINPDEPGAVDRVLQEADKLPSSSPQAERVLPVTIDLLARTNRQEQAKQRINTALQSEPSLSAKTLAGLMQISIDHQLGLDAAIAKQIESQFGMTPELALTNALAKAKTDGFEQGLAIIEQATPSPATMPWQKAKVDYLTILQRESAGALLIKLAEEYPNDIATQLAALNANQPEGNDDLFEKLIARLRDQAGESTIHWRLQQARVGMRNANDQQALRQTADLLSDAEELAPVHLELRMVLSRCFMMLGDDQAAADRAQTAKIISPINIQVMLLHGTAQHRLNRYEASRLELVPLATNPLVSPTVRQQACFMLAEQGDTATVQEAIEQMWAADQASSAALMLLARSYSDTRQYTKADKVCEYLLTVPNVDIIRFVSIYYHQTNRPELAKQAILAAQGTGISETDRMTLLAEDAAQRGDLEDAIKLSEQAAIKQPDQPERWHKAVKLALSLGKPDEANRLAKLGLESVPNDAGLTALVQHAKLIQQTKDDATLIPMALAILGQQADHKLAVHVLEITSELGQTENAALALAELAGQNQEFQALTELACNRLLQAGKIETLYPMARSAMARFPDSVIAARATTLCAFRLEDWSELLAAATAWEDRAPNNRTNAQLMQAIAMNKTGRFAGAIKILEPYARSISEVTESNQSIFEYYTHALVRNNQSAQALAMLRPHLKASSPARKIALNRVSEDLPQADTVNAWLNEIAANSSDSVQDRYAIVTGLFQSGQRLGDESLIRRAEQAINSLPDGPGPMQLEIQYAKGQIAHRLGNYDLALTYYRQIQKKLPNNPQVLNNLALVMVESSSGDLAQAEQLSTKATQLAPKDPNLLDTLAIVHLRRGQLDKALTTIDKAIRMESNNPEWQMTKADILDAMGQTDRATQIREQFAPRPQN